MAVIPGAAAAGLGAVTGGYTRHSHMETSAVPVATPGAGGRPAGADEFSAGAHDGQTRRSGEPYIVHPVAVATILTDLHLDCATICAALLHDVAEDTEFGIDRLSSEFGPEIASL